MRRLPFLVLFALSGAAALVYEVVWTRLLTLQVGHGLAAASTVLAAFMGGLAVGAAAGGRVGQRLDPRAALRVYAGLELAIAAAALVLPWIFSALTPLLAAAYQDGRGGFAFGALRFILSLTLLAVPAAAMGATFPIATRWMARHAAALSHDAGVLYAANTLGATAGAVAAGFVLLPALGLMGATLVGVALNVVAAAGAWYLAGQVDTATPPVPPPVPSRGTRVVTVTEDGRPMLAALALGVTGFASLSLQVVWTRLLASILGPTTYAFSAVVALFVLGIAIGASIGARLVTRGTRPVGTLAVVVALSGVFALASAAAVDWALLDIARLVATPGVAFRDVLLREWLVTALLLLPLAITFGAAFPIALAVAARRDDTMVSDLGTVYAVNTAGAILGSLATGFVLVPWLGLHDTIRLVAALTALTAGGLALASRGRTMMPAALAAVTLVAVALAPGWDPRLLSSGGYKYAAGLRGPDLETALTAGELLYYREGATATVSVRRLTGTTSLGIDGKVDASDSADMLTQRLLAHVPLLLHPNPRRAAILGLGSGVTLGSALTHGLEQAVVLEISPEVVEASRFFDDRNHRALADPRTRLVAGDGRTHLLLSREQYDVIVSEPSNPWMAGIASLFTREFFQIARSRLAPGGVLCQWAHTYDISDANIRSIVATFLEVFPGGSAFLVGEADLLLIGSDGPITERLAHVAPAFGRAGVAADLASVGIRSPLGVLSLFLADSSALAAWAGNAEIQTDNRGSLEFSGPRNIFGADRPDNAAVIAGLRTAAPRPDVVRQAESTATPEAWRQVGEMLLDADAFTAAYGVFQRLVDASPADTAALDGLVRASVPAGRREDTRAHLARLAGSSDGRAARLALSKLAAAEGNYEEAARLPLAILQQAPGDPDALNQLASVLADAGDADRLAPVVARLQADQPAKATTRYYAATLAYLHGRPDITIREAEAALTLDAGEARAANLLGAALAGLGQRDRAREAFALALRIDARDPATYANLGTLELESGNRSGAERYFTEALTLDPQNEGARQGLVTARSRTPIQ
ncbi:MAG: fused MFS/spermidine synthase [Acidobacteria bacterium]|nr:fused MFS/spermidine synthase [Acidobacteriota bacterium]